MESSPKKEDSHSLTIISTCNYGLVSEKSKHYSFTDTIKETILEYRISKIKCQLKSNQYISGIQITCINRNDLKELKIIDVQPNSGYDIEQECEIDSLEHIEDMRVWLKERLTGFEITTSKKKVKMFGYDNGEDAIKVPDLENRDNVVVGFGLYASDTEGVTSIYGYFVNAKKYCLSIYSGIFYLKMKLKDEHFKKKTIEKLPNMEEKLQILYRVCSLPDSTFFGIVKFALS